MEINKITVEYLAEEITKAQLIVTKWKLQPYLTITCHRSNKYIYIIIKNDTILISTKNPYIDTKFYNNDLVPGTNHILKLYDPDIIDKMIKYILSYLKEDARHII